MTDLMKKSKVLDIDLKQAFMNENLPTETRKKYNEILETIKNDITIPEKFSDILQETSLGTSVFQDRSFVINERLTPHKQLRQCIQQLQDRYAALYTAKSGVQKAKIKVLRLEAEISKLQKEVEKMKSDPSFDEEDVKLKELDLMEKQVEYNDALRDQKSSLHLVKDAIQKVALYENLEKDLRKKVEESGIGYDEAEIEFFIMYFTRDLETQLRTMGKPDPGTLQSISHLPKPLRDKMRNNLLFLQERIIENPKKLMALERELIRVFNEIEKAKSDIPAFTDEEKLKRHKVYLNELEEYYDQLQVEYNELRNKVDDFMDADSSGDFLYLKYWDILKPQKTGEGEYEGLNIKDYLTMEPVISVAKALKE